MTTRTDSSASLGSGSVPASPSATQHKPSVALAIATACGIGYIPIAPGTWGSLVGVLIYFLAFFYFPLASVPGRHPGAGRAAWIMWIGAPIAAAIALVGLWAADRAAKFLRMKDPNCIVVDEVSGQFVTYLLALAPLNWKYLSLGFILFRVFDIWKPPPARQAESLPGGLGIMADDWMAGIYAAIGLWIARAAGL